MAMHLMATDMVMVTHQQKNNTLSILLQKRSNWVFFALSAISVLPLLYLFWKFGEAGFGYDIGIYRRSASEYFGNFFQAGTPPFAFSAFSSLILFLGDSLSSFLITWYSILIFFTTYTFGILVRKITHSNILACLALLLFSTSILQFEFFAGFYYRNILALFFMFSTLLLLEYKSQIASLPLLVLTAIHPLTAFVFYPTLFLLGIFQKEQRKLLFTTLLIAGVGSILLSWNEFYHYIQTLFGFLQNKAAILAHSSEFTGQFIHSSQFFRFTLPYLPFALIGFYREGKKYIFWSIFGIINLVLILFQFFLFERFYLFLNISLIVFAAHGMLFVFRLFQNKKILYTLIFAYSFLLFGAGTLYISKKVPFIAPTELTKIKQLSHIIPAKNFILSFSSYNAAWLYGFAGDYKIIATGTLHENKWNYEKWSQFWSDTDTKKRAELLREYNANEIYIYTGEAFKDIGQKLFSEDPSITKINPYLWKYQFSL